MKLPASVYSIFILLYFYLLLSRLTWCLTQVDIQQTFNLYINDLFLCFAFCHIQSGLCGHIFRWCLILLGAVTLWLTDSWFVTVTNTRTKTALPPQCPLPPPCLLTHFSSMSPFRSTSPTSPHHQTGSIYSELRLKRVLWSHSSFSIFPYLYYL